MLVPTAFVALRWKGGEWEQHGEGSEAFRQIESKVKPNFDRRLAVRGVNVPDEQNNFYEQQFLCAVPVLKR